MMKIDSNKNVYVSADFHWFHTKPFIVQKRGFNTVEEHNSFGVNTINNIVAKNDILIVLGDFCLNATQDEFESVISKINCDNLYYIWGNHNSRIAEGYRQAKRQQYNVGDDVDIYPIRYKNIVYIGDYKEIFYNNQHYIMFHYPITSWNSMSRNSIMVHGHVHGGIEASLPTHTESGKILDAGWDVFNRPVHLNEIKEICDKKKYKKVDAHH